MMMQTPDSALLTARPADLLNLKRQLIREIAIDELRLTRQNADVIRSECMSFAGFVRRAWPVLEPSTPLVWNWHLDAICEHLEAITFGRMSPRLIINISPGSMKSLLVSVMWQAWMWGPCGMAGKRFLSTSYEMKAVTRDTRKTRDLIQSEWYKALWPSIFDANGKLEREGETSFANRHTGSREGVAFASLMSKRGDVLCVDDPHSLDGAESEVERTKSVRRFIEGGQSRINDRVHSAIVIVMQRLHMEDLSGAVLARNLGYEHLMIPMRYESARTIVTQIGWKDPRTFDGELMDPIRFPESEVQKEEQAEYPFAGQYQQRPAPREGGMFKVDKIEIVDFVPAGAKPTRGWDLAGSTRKTSAYTAGVRMSRVAGVTYVEDVIRERKGPAAVEQLILAAATNDGFAVVQDLPQDPAQAGLAQKLRFAELLAGFQFSITPERGKKEDRALALASQVDAGMVRLVRAPWNAAFIDELRNFPNGTYKDQVDAAARAFTRLLMGSKMQRLGGGVRLFDGADGADFD